MPVKTARNRADCKVRQVIQDSEAACDPMRKSPSSEKTYGSLIRTCLITGPNYTRPNGQDCRRSR